MLRHWSERLNIVPPFRVHLGPKVPQDEVLKTGSEQGKLLQEFERPAKGAVQPAAAYPHHQALSRAGV